MIVPVTGKLSCDNADILLDLAVAGVGIGRVGDFLAHEALLDGRLVQLLDAFHDDEASQIAALTLPGRHNIPKVRAFVEFLKSNFNAKSQDVLD